MDIQSVNGRPASSDAVQETSSAGLASDFDTFLTLLTAQIRNQDPLNPAESTEFVAQLATFSNVEQSVLTNDLLKDLGTQLSLQSMGDLAGWVGMEVRGAMPVQLDDTPVTLLPNTPLVADRAQLVVRNLDGEEVQRISIDPDAPEIEWDGIAPDGSAVPHGVYGLYVESWAGERQLDSATVETYAQVQEAVQSADGIALRLPGDIEMPASQVRGIRNAFD